MTRTLFSLLLCLVVAVPARGAAPRDPYQLVRETTSRILAITLQAKRYYSEDPERYYEQVGAVLDPVMDFRGFARGVMATYASARLYKGLETEAEKTAFQRRVELFSRVLKRMLIVSYAEAVLSFNGQRIEVEQPARPPTDDWVTVRQDIHGADGRVYVIQYQMRREEDEGWKVRNLVVDGVNLGQVYRTQFAEAVERAGGDLDRVIRDWAREKAGMELSPEASGP